MPPLTPSAPDNALIRVHQLSQAIRLGKIEEAKRLIPSCDPRLLESEPLRVASLRGEADLVALLIPVSNLSARSFQAFQLAAADGRIECLRLLRGS